jgi:hypothetical protein
MLWLLVSKLSVHEIPAILAASTLSYIIDEAWIYWHQKRQSDELLIQVIVTASIALIAFDWATTHTPVSLPFRGVNFQYLALFFSLAAWILIWFFSLSRAGTMLRLGIRNRWAMEYWAQPLPKSPILQKAIVFLCWIPVLTVPVLSTGILSSTILKDVAIAIMIARVVSSRRAQVVLAICVMLGLLRTAAGYTFAGSAGPPIVEAAIFVCLLIWLRYRTSRTAWGEISDR